MSCCSSKPKDTFTILEKQNVQSPVVDTIKPYQPLIVMVGLVLIGSVTLSYSLGLSWMPIFMGLFLLNFAMFKLFDVAGFAKSFAMYDIVARRSKLYATIYPLIELALAVGFLSGLYLNAFSVVTAIIMIVGLVGVIQNRRMGNQTRCACMGNLINVPVGSITILENTSMIVMSILMLTHLI